MSDNITIDIEQGLVGGAPPERKWRGHSIGKVTVSKHQTLKQLDDYLHQVHGKRFNFHDHRHEEGKTLEQLGIHNDSVVKVSLPNVFD